MDVSFREDGADVRIQSQGLSNVPVRLEWGFLPGCVLRNENFVLQSTAGGSMTVCGGSVQAEKNGGDAITLTPAFARHTVQNRMGGAYPLSRDHFTVFFSDLSPFDQMIHIGVKPVFGMLL